MNQFEEAANRLAVKANECCHRSDGYEEDMAKAIAQQLQHFYRKGYNQALKDTDPSFR